MSPTVRPLTEDDTEQMERQFREAFGSWDPPDPPVSMHAAGKRWWGVEDGGRIVATALDREYDSWFRGVRVPTAGIGGVTVAAEHRGRGLVRPMMTALLDAARERGAAISTLYATAPGIYRSFGYEAIGSLDTVRVPTAALRTEGPITEGLTARRADPSDADAIRAVHERWASRRQGPLSHSGPLFRDPPTLRVDAVTVVERPDGSLSGYTRWDRGRGYGTDAEITVHDLVADDAGSALLLMSTIASFVSVTGTAAVTTSAFATWRHLLRGGEVSPSISRPYSLSVLDPAALALGRFAPGIEARTDVEIGGRSVRLEVADGRATARDVETPGARRLTAGGLALTFSGTERSSVLRELGHLEGDESDDATWDALFCRGPVEVTDYF